VAGNIKSQLGKKPREYQLFSTLTGRSTGHSKQIIPEFIDSLNRKYPRLILRELSRSRSLALKVAYKSGVLSPFIIINVASLIKSDIDLPLSGRERECSGILSPEIRLILPKVNPQCCPVAVAKGCTVVATLHISLLPEQDAHIRHLSTTQVDIRYAKR